MVDKKGLIGKRFGRLTVISYSHSHEKYKSQTFWSCKCDCGNTVIVSRSNLRKNGGQCSCGCSKKERLTIHGHSQDRLYKIWQNMKRRCNNPVHKNFIYYGGRGIKVCDEWMHDFCSFYDWAMNNGYNNNLTIDRIDINGKYEPSNCRWITISEQQSNKSSNNFISYKGEIHTLTEWAEILGINRKTLSARLRYNWTVEKTFSTPVRKYHTKEMNDAL